MARPRIAVLLGTTREGRLSARVAEWVLDRLTALDLFEVEPLDLRDHPLPFFDGRPPAHSLREYPTEQVARLGRRLDAADGFVVLTGEYNHGYPAVLKNAIDHTFVEWRRKPIAFIGWGNVGGARAIEQLREVAVELEMAPLRHAVHLLPDTMRAVRATADTNDLTPFGNLDPRLTLLAEDLAWWTAALSAAREASGD